MERNMELVLKILLKLEEIAPKDVIALPGIDLEIDGYDGEEIEYNTILMADAGLISMQKELSQNEMWLKPIRLAWAGHEFLDKWRGVASYTQKTPSG